MMPLELLQCLQNIGLIKIVNGIVLNCVKGICVVILGMSLILSTVYKI